MFASDLVTALSEMKHVTVVGFAHHAHVCLPFQQRRGPGSLYFAGVELQLQTCFENPSIFLQPACNYVSIALSCRQPLNKLQGHCSDPLLDRLQISPASQNSSVESRPALAPITNP